MAFVKEIRQNTIDSHQVSPSYVLTFMRWSNRSTKYYKAEEALAVRDPMVVYSDAISIVTTDAKSQMSSTATIVLKCGDINYSTAVSPGDFVIINMVNSEQKAQIIHDKALTLKPINEIDDGFKGLYKIQNVVKTLRVEKESGHKTLFVTVTAAAFTEFNNVVFYNPAIVQAFAQKGTDLYFTAIGDYYSDLLKSDSSIDVVVKSLFKILIGQSFKKADPKIRNYGNTHFRIPPTLGSLLGRPDITFANQIFNYVVGIWKDSTNGSQAQKDLGTGLNPSFSKDSNNISTGIPIRGNKLIQMEDWNNQTAWSIIQANINSVINEMYTTFRVGPDNRVYPTVVVRQKPFTSEHFKSTAPVTRFFQVPRWKVSANLMYELQTSKNESARFNFIQVFTRQTAATLEQDMANQISEGNFDYDPKDIERNGLRPYVTRSNFDFPVTNGKAEDKALHGKDWAFLVSDWIADGHLKESGVLTFQGLIEPISVGDNIEFDGIIYHIEAVNQSMAIQGDKKSWTTKITVSYGMDMRSDKTGPVYANMQFTDAQTNNQDDWNNERILPGISDTQDISGRVLGEEITPTKEKSFTPAGVGKGSRTKSNEPNNGENPRAQKKADK